MGLALARERWTGPERPHGPRSRAEPACRRVATEATAAWEVPLGVLLGAWLTRRQGDLPLRRCPRRRRKLASGQPQPGYPKERGEGQPKGVRPRRWKDL